MLSAAEVRHARAGSRCWRPGRRLASADYGRQRSYTAGRWSGMSATRVAASPAIGALEGSCGVLATLPDARHRVIAVTAQRLEADLAAGLVTCPDCGERLSRWGYGRSREVRMEHDTRELTPRRTICTGCKRTLLCPSWSLPRRRDAAAVIGWALALAVDGQGHRPIAARLVRPPATVRGWLRAARARAESLRACASRWACSVDPCQGPVTPAGSELGDRSKRSCSPPERGCCASGPPSPERCGPGRSHASDKLVLLPAARGVRVRSLQVHGTNALCRGATCRATGRSGSSNRCSPPPATASSCARWHH